MSIRHDYKSAATGQRRQRARRHGLLVITLILIGLFGGLLAYIKGDQPQMPPSTAAVAPAIPTQPPAAPAAPPPQAVVAPAAGPEPAKPKYDFYTELPKRQIDVQSEAAKPGNTHQPAPARRQPAVNQLHKPTAPRGNAKTSTPTMAVVSGSRPDSKVTTSKTPNSKATPSKSTTARIATSEPANSKSTSTPSKSAPARTANSEPASSRTANSTTTSSKPAPAKTANSEPVNSKSTSTNSRPASTKPANVTAAPATIPAQTTPPRPLANNDSKIVVKTR